ncbi:MAG: hypothetical protein RSP_17890 [Rhodanobacter sp.]
MSHLFLDLLTFGLLFLFSIVTAFLYPDRRVWWRFASGLLIALTMYQWDWQATFVALFMSTAIFFLWMLHGSRMGDEEAARRQFLIFDDILTLTIFGAVWLLFPQEWMGLLLAISIPAPFVVWALIKSKAFRGGVMATLGAVTVLLPLVGALRFFGLH